MYRASDLAECLKQSKKGKMGQKCGACIGGSPYKAGSLSVVAREIVTFNLYCAGVE